MITIDKHTTREELIEVWHNNKDDMRDAFIDAHVDPDSPNTPTEAIREVIISWIEAGD